MAKKRASLRGRGNEILMGAGPDERAEPTAETESQLVARADEPRPSSKLAEGPERETTAPAVESRHVEDDGQELSPEWTDLLQEEAVSASGSQPPALHEGAMADIDLSLPPLATTPARPNRPTGETPDDALPSGGDVSSDAVESASGLAAVPARAAEGPGIAFEGPTPPAPTYLECYDSDPAGGAYVPAPKEKPEATDTAMRAKLGELLYQRATLKPSNWDREPDGPKGPEMAIQEVETGENGRLFRPRQEPEILKYVGEAQQRALWDETLKLYQVVPDALSGDEDQARALRLLQEAQDILLGKPSQYDMAIYKVGQVQTLVTWRLNVIRWSSTYGWGIFIYEVVWIVVLVLGVLMAERVAELVIGMVGSVPGIGGLSHLWGTMMWGGLGGVMGAFYSLYWHVAKIRDFDKQYTMWYAVQPVIGLLLGALVHLLIGPGFLAALGVNQQSQTVIGTLFPYAVACVVGFRQRFALEMIDRVVQAITPSPRPKQSSVEETDAEEMLDSSE